MSSSSYSLPQNVESEAAKVFKEVAYDMTDVEFAITVTPEVFQKYEVKASSVVLFKKVCVLQRSSGNMQHIVMCWLCCHLVPSYGQLYMEPYFSLFVTKQL